MANHRLNKGIIELRIFLHFFFDPQKKTLEEGVFFNGRPNRPVTEKFTGGTFAAAIKIRNEDLQVLTGQTIDISILLIFLFWDVVFLSRHNDSSYSGQVGHDKSSDFRGWLVGFVVGFAWSVGHALTFKVLADDTKRVIC